MEEVSKEEAAATASASISKLRYPLRSATKLKEEKTTPPDVSKNSDSKRGRPGSSISKSMNVLDLSGKEKSAKPPRRLSIPAKPTVNPVSKTTGYITPISEARAKRSITSQGRSNTPASDVSNSGNRKRFSILSSASYWLSQIKLSESAAKHAISLSFFKLALEAKCEPIQRIRDELKSYARRHNLVEIGELAKEVFESYNISENLEQSQVSETISHVPEGTRSSEDDVHSFSSTMGTGKLKPKSLNVDALQASTVAESAKKESSQKTNNSSIRTRGSLNKSSASKQESGSHNLRMKPQKASKQESKRDKEKIKKQGKKGASEEANPLPAEETAEENKENMDAPPLEDISSAEVI